MSKKIYFAHREPKDFSDRVALFMVRILRKVTDVATGYKHNVSSPKKAGDANAVALLQLSIGFRPSMRSVGGRR
jgi:hypothetical protein